MRYCLPLTLVMALAAYGQDPTRLVFDVASIKPHVPRTDRQSIQVDNGVLIANNSVLADSRLSPIEWSVVDER